MEAILVSEYAGLIGVSERCVQKKIQNGKLKAIETAGRGGRSGKLYKIPINELPEKAKIKYLEKSKADIISAVPAVQVENNTGFPVEYGAGCSFAMSFKEELSFEAATAEQREKALWLKEMLFVWRQYRSEHGGSLAEADIEFLNRINSEFNKPLTVHQLYRYQKSYNEYGEIGLVDFRGVKNKGRSEIDKDLWAVFEYLYLEENEPTAAYCYEQTKLWALKYRSDINIPSYSAFNRMIKQIPDPIIKLYRLGNKAFVDNCEKYITRMVEDLQPNDIWVADNHTIDVISQKDGTEVKHRMYFTAFVDARSRLLVGFNITDTPNSESTLLALRDAIMKYGKPKMIYVDNGREFLTNDIGGRGHRKGKKEKDTCVPPTILQLLEIKMINALPRNAKAKVIERWFREFTSHFAVLFNTYIGSNPVKRPEYTKYSVKSGNIVKDSEIVAFADRFINGYMNARPQYGRGMNGKSALEVWNENIVNKIVVPKDKLNLLLMRISRPILVKQNGVRLRIYNDTIWYYEQRFAYEHMNKTEVYVRYDPKDLSSVRVYDLEDRFLAELPLDETAVGSYISDSDDIKEKMKNKRQLKKLVKSEYDKRIYSGADRMTSYEIVNMVIDENLKHKYTNNAIETEFEYEEKQYAKAVNSQDDEFEMLKRMAENISKRKED